MSGQRAFLWTVLRCREQQFQQFLGVAGEIAAAQRVKEVCEVLSRAELDRDPAAEARWSERIRLPYQKFQQQKATINHNQDQEM